MVAEKFENQLTNTSNKGFIDKLTRLKNRIPLRTVLIVPFIIQIFAAVALVEYVSFKNSQEAVSDVVSQLRREIVNRVGLRLKSYLETPRLINENNDKSYKLNLIDISNQDALGRHFWKQKQVFGVNSIYFGNRSGGYVGAEPRNGTIVTTITENFLPGRFLYFNTDDKGFKINNPDIGQKYFDSRTRPWYQVSENKKGSRWSDIYTYEDGSDIAIAATRPLYSDGKFEGVLAADLSLRQINQYLKKIGVGKTGEVFILERKNGLVVGTSTNEKTYFEQGNEFKRLAASESNYPLVRKSTEFLRNEFGSLKNINKTQQLEFDIKGKRQYLQVTDFKKQVPEFKDDYGLDWLIVVVIPEADFMAQIHANQRTTLLFCLLALIIAIIIGILTARRISQPILRLNKAVKDITTGKWEATKTIHDSRISEVSELASSFHSMAHQLHQSFDTLEEKNEELQRLDKLKDEFLANTSHELRTPLNGMIGIAESMIDGATGEITPLQQKNLLMIANSGHRLLELVNDIFDFSASQNLRYR
ncbi:MAG: cache domain-containing protein, partial [Cyanobacteria bacterium J06573_2]